jgi:glycine/D-amino acid oxidase-like deaminating enzyme
LTEFDEVVDVVVVGSGGGIAGAYTAAREGLSVLLVEATDKFGGTSAYSGGGGMWFPCNPVLQRAGSDDTLDKALDATVVMPTPLMPTPPSAKRRWKSISSSVTSPLGDRPSEVAALMMRLRSFTGPNITEAKGSGAGAC